MRRVAQVQTGRPFRFVAHLVTVLYPFAVLGVLWWALASWLDRPFAMPAPDVTWTRAKALWSGDAFGLAPPLGTSVVSTLFRIGLAFLLASLSGVAVGCALGRSRWFRQLFRPLVSVGFPIPKLALYPGIVIALGLGSSSKVALGFLEAFFPIAIGTSAATSQVPEQLLWSARSMGCGTPACIGRVVIPSASPGIMTALRVGLVGAIVGVFLAEMIFPSSGVGAVMVASYRTIDAPGVYVAVVSVAVMGLVADQLFLAVRRRMLHWAPEGDGPRGASLPSHWGRDLSSLRRQST